MRGRAVDTPANTRCQVRQKGVWAGGGAGSLVGGQGRRRREAGLSQNRPVLSAGSKVDRPGVKGFLPLLVGSAAVMTPQGPIIARGDHFFPGTRGGRPGGPGPGWA
jgi:hypothetical protein